MRAASPKASKAARGSSKKRDTTPELALRQALRDHGLRAYRVDPPDLVGRPDVVFRRERVAVFCDGDFWHGRELVARITRLAGGHNAPYWVAKIKGNVARDRRVDDELRKEGWEVLRFWETDVKKDAKAAASRVAYAVKKRKAP